MSELIISALKLGDSQQALELAKGLIEQSPNQAESFYWLALAYQQLNEKSKALEAIDKAIVFAPDRNEYVMLRSFILLDDKDFIEAQSGLMDALAVNPNQLNAYIGLIHIALAQKNIPEAKRLLKLAERVDADDSNVLVAKGAIAQAEGNIDQALKYYSAATELSPNNPLALSNLGLCYLLKKLPVFAEQALKRANELAPNNLIILRALVQSQINQDSFDSAEKSVSELLLFKPDDVSSLHMRAKLRLRNQDNHGALADIQALCALLPSDVNLLSQLCTLLLNLGRREEARQAILDATQQNLKNDSFWQFRNGFESMTPGYSNSVILEWLSHLPNSPFAHEANAVFFELIGDLQSAQAAAEKSLSISEKMPSAQFVKLRQEIRDNPRAALVRIQTLAQNSAGPEAQRMINAWLGIIYDQLKEFDQAAVAFTQMATYPKPSKGLPKLMPAQQPIEQKVEGCLLWSTVGARVERVFNVVGPILGNRLLIDRNNPSPARQDGFCLLRFAPNIEEAGTAVRWQAGIHALGFESKDVVDWLPHWDAYTDSALEGANLLALCIDPRDAFLNWMVFDNAQAFTFLPNILESVEWLAMVFEAVAETIENKPNTAHLVKLDEMETRSPEICQALQESLGLEQTPDPQKLALPIMSLGGMANQFPSGHWRNYQPFFTEAFARLTPVAVRLGYSET